MTTTTLHRLIHDGDLAGYRPGPPPRSGLLDGPTLDAAICAAATCTECGHVGLDYAPYHSTTPGKAWSYRAFAVCPLCRHADEF